MHSNFRGIISTLLAIPLARSTRTLPIPEFLAPRIVRNARKRYISTSIEHHVSLSRDVHQPHVRPKVEDKKFAGHLPLLCDRHAPDAWIEALEKVLPEHLRLSTSGITTESFIFEEPVQYVSYILSQAMTQTQIDLLTVLGVEKGRWEVVMWIVRSLVEKKASTPILEEFIKSATFQSPVEGSLDDITRNHWVDLSVHYPPTSYALDEMVDSPIHDLYKGKHTLGQVWHSLGNMIICAAEETLDNDELIMPHVLEILAYLHHMELISDQIYSDNPNRDLLALRQPPALHLLSSQIFTSLSDAAWNAHETAAQKAKSSQVVQYDWIGREIPGSRYKVQVSSLGPEIWLELVLWSCLYGGWISEGAEIIAKLKQSSGEKRWSLICWRDMLAAVENPGNQIPDKAYRDRKLVEKTISSEVVAAYVDALLNDIRINVGARGMAPQIALDHIRNLKRFLDAQNMSLAPTSWGAVVSRYLDWEGVVLERAPSLASLALRLLPAFREEIESINVSPNGALSESTSYYTFEPSAAPLGLLNRTLNGFVEKGDINGLLTGFDRLQKYTDVNKRRSLEVLLSRARSSTQDGRDLVKGVFDSNLDASQFPAFYPQIPPHILSSIMDLITSSKAYEFGRWLLYSTDIDGPIIPDSMYNNAKIAKSLITFAFASGDKQLFAKILDRQKLTTGENNEKISNEVLLALLESQISSRDWGSVQNLLKYMGQSPTGWNVTAAVLLARELLRLESEISLSGNEEKEQSFSQVKELFRFLVQNGYGNVEKGGHLTITSILGFLACTNREWAIFSSTLRSRSTAQAVSMSTQQFNILLEGAVQRAGSGEGTRLVKMWSRDIMPPSPESGGLVTLPATRPKHHNEVDSLSPLEIDACIESHEPFLFYGRVETDLSTLRIILSAFIKENIDGMEQRNVGNYQLQEDLKMFNWLRKKMKAFGLTATEIEHEVDGIIAIEARKSTVSRKVGP